MAHLPSFKSRQNERVYRPQRQPQVEFGGRVMLERMNYYMSLNQKPHSPIKVSSRYIYSQQLVYIPHAFFSFKLKGLCHRLNHNWNRQNLYLCPMKPKNNGILKIAILEHCLLASIFGCGCLRCKRTAI